MSLKEVEQLLDDKSTWLQEQIAFEPEIEAIQKLLNEYLKDIEDLAKSNADLKLELKQIIDQYEER